MDLEANEKLVFTETSARRYLLGFCWKNHQRFCPRCRCRKVYRLADGRRQKGYFRVQRPDSVRNGVPLGALCMIWPAKTRPTWPAGTRCSAARCW